METTERVNPLLALSQPREVFPRLAEQSSLGWFLLLAALSGVESSFSELLDVSASEAARRPVLALFALHTALGCLRGIVGLSLLAALLVVATRVMRMPVAGASVRAVLGWASLPSVPLLVLLWLLFASRPADFIALGAKEFQEQSPLLWWPLLLLRLGVGLWSLALLVLGLSAVTKQSMARVAGAYLVAAVTFWGMLNIGLFLLTWAAPGLMESLKSAYASW
jgi:hypothetical protein